MWKNLVPSNIRTKYGACALHAGCLRLQTQHLEYVILISIPRHNERASVLRRYIHWPFMFFPTIFPPLLSQTPVYLLLVFLFDLSHNLHCSFLLIRNTQSEKGKAAGWTVRGLNIDRTKEFSFLQIVQTCSPTWPPIQWVLASKATRNLEVHHSSPPNTEFKFLKPNDIYIYVVPQR